MTGARQETFSSKKIMKAEIQKTFFENPPAARAGAFGAPARGFGFCFYFYFFERAYPAPIGAL
ncbi:MAG: hypothetical protein DBY30_02100 [Verrucomicrobia bacterium]|nr:MAG: hypothetical protein DBY30_02100 [Verrucomicrobiota bacterium]